MSEYLNELVESYNQYIEKLIPGIDIIIGNLEKTSIDSVIPDLLNLIEGTSWLIEMNSNIGSEFNPQKKDLQTLNEINTELINLIEIQDSYILKDFLEYEYREVILSLEKIKLTEGN